MLVGADLYPCNRHTLSPPPRHLASGDASVTIRALLNGLAKYELRRMFSAKRVPLALRWVPGQLSRYFWGRVQQPIVDVPIRTLRRDSSRSGISLSEERAERRSPS